jgi:hypothetical protein
VSKFPQKKTLFCDLVGLFWELSNTKRKQLRNLIGLLTELSNTKELTMPITESFSEFAKIYHKNNGTTMPENEYLPDGVRFLLRGEQPSSSDDESDEECQILSDDILHIVGKEVQKKRDQETRDYWSEQGRRRGSFPFMEFIEQMEEICADYDWLRGLGQSMTLIEFLAYKLRCQGDRWIEEGGGGGDFHECDLYDDMDFWEDLELYTTRSFMNGNVYKSNPEVE